MARKWFIHRFYHGMWHSVSVVRDDFDAIDMLTKRMAEIHGKNGWSYQISGSDEPPKQTALIAEPLMIS
jgi:hypothetical protein